MIRRIARPLLGSIFVYNGYTGLTTDPGRRAAAAAPLVNKATESLPESTVVPTNARTWVRAVAGVQLGGGLLLATGRIPRVASLALAGTLVPTTAIDHAFWSESDPAARRDQQVQFVKNLSLLGGLLIAGFDTEGRPGVAWRARHAAEKASSRVSDATSLVTDKVAAITPGGDHDDSAWRERAHAVQQYGADVVERAKPAVAGAVDKAKPAVAEAVDKAKPAVAHAVEKARPAVEHAVDKAEPALSDAAETASGLLSSAGERLKEFRDEAVRRRR